MNILLVDASLALSAVLLCLTLCLTRMTEALPVDPTTGNRGEVRILFPLHVSAVKQMLTTQLGDDAGNNLPLINAVMKSLSNGTALRGPGFVSSDAYTQITRTAMPLSPSFTKQFSILTVASLDNERIKFEKPKDHELLSASSDLFSKKVLSGDDITACIEAARPTETNKTSAYSTSAGAHSGAADARTGIGNGVASNSSSSNSAAPLSGLPRFLSEKQCRRIGNGSGTRLKSGQSYQFAYDEGEDGFTRTALENWKPVRDATAQCRYLNDAAVYHMLGNHQYCTKDVCKHKQAATVPAVSSETPLETIHQDYIHLVVGKRLSEDLLFRVARGVRTQACEGLWSMVVRFTHGKRLHYSGTGRWQSFVRMCACAMNDGWKKTLNDLHTKMDISPLQITKYHREQREIKETYAREHGKLTKTKVQKSNSTAERRAIQSTDMQDKLRHGATVFEEQVSRRQASNGDVNVNLEKCNRCNAILVESHDHCKMPAKKKGARLPTTRKD
jgi:hypothetical protein